MTLEQAIATALVLMLASMVQSAVGFGAGVVAIPVLVWLGLPLYVAVPLLLCATVIQIAWGCYRLRHELDWVGTLPFNSLRVLTLPVGVWLMGVLVEIGQSRVKQVVGVVLLAVLIVRSALRVQPRASVHAGWTVLAGAASGLLGGLVGMGGTPMVLWVTAHDWPNDRSRAFLWLTMVQLYPITLALLTWRFGTDVLWAALIGLLYAPAALLGTWLGMHMGGLMSGRQLRVTMMVLLLLIALNSLAAPWLP